MSRDSTLRVALLYPELLGTYGDGGNAAVLTARAGWRGQAVELVEVPAGSPAPAQADLYLLGGGEDEPQALAADGLRTAALPAAIAGGAVLLAVCAGFQIAGEHFPTAAGPHAGMGLLPVTTAAGGPRIVGDLAVLADAALGLTGDAALLLGYENHSGRTTLGAGAAPLGRVVTGTGNGAAPPDGQPAGAVDGALLRHGAGWVVGTYLHGPVLAQNPALADRLLTLATGQPLPTAAADALHTADTAATALRAARRRQLGL